MIDSPLSKVNLSGNEALIFIMSLNPFTAIEKLITEHGSAAILRERLALASDQYAALERRISELTNALETLRAENEGLTSPKSCVCSPLGCVNCVIQED